VGGVKRIVSLLRDSFSFLVRRMGIGLGRKLAIETGPSFVGKVARTIDHSVRGVSVRSVSVRGKLAIETGPSFPESL